MKLRSFTTVVLLACAAGFTGFASVAAAQGDFPEDEGWPEPVTGATPAFADGAAASPGWTEILYQGRIRARYEWSGENDFAEGDELGIDNDGRVRDLARLHVMAKPRPDLLAGIEFSHAGNWGDNTRTNSSEPAATEPGESEAADRDPLDVHQAYFKLLDLAGGPLELTVGRQEIEIGTGRLFSAREYENEGVAFDALRFNLDFDFLTLGGFGAELPWSQSVYGFVFGLETEHTNVELQHYWLRDPYGDGLAESRHTSGVGYRGDYLDGVLSTNIEAYLQFGEIRGRGADCEDGGNGPAHAGAEGLLCGEKQDIDAAAATAGLKVVLPVPTEPFIGIGFDYASGDPSVEEGKPDKTAGTFNPLFGMQHEILGHADLVGWRNISDFNAAVGVSPLDGFDIELALHVFNLDSTADSWYGIEGEPMLQQYINDDTVRRSDAGTDLGNEIDLTISYAPWEQLMLEGGYSRFIAGGYITKVQGLEELDLSTVDRDSVYLSAEVRFK